jgi:hypothetical protein
MHLILRRYDIGKDRPPILQQRSGGIVAGSFDTEN